MPQHKSCKKRVITSEKARLANKVVRSKMRTAGRTLEVADNSETVVDLVKTYCSSIDKAAKKGIIHKKKASRLKSKAMKKGNTITASAK